MKHLLIVMACVFALSTAQAVAAETPTERVWITPKDAAIGAPVTISAFVYNDRADTITYTLESKAADTRISTNVLTLAGGSAKTLTIPWKVPETPTTVTVSIVSALGKDKKDIPALHGRLGAVSVGEKTIESGIDTGTHAALSAIGSAKAYIESFRLKQAKHFTGLRDSTRVKLGLEKSDSSPEVFDTAEFQIEKVDSSGDYAMLVIFSGLASFFSHEAAFYIVSILLVLLVLRFFFKLFV